MHLLNILQIIIAIALMTVILLQSSGSGLSGIFGGGGNVFRSKRGLEKKLFYATIVFAILFFLVSLATVINF